MDRMIEVQAAAANGRMMHEQGTQHEMVCFRPSDLEKFAQLIRAEERAAIVSACDALYNAAHDFERPTWATLRREITKRSNDQLERGRAQENEETKGGVSASARSDS